MDVRRCCDYPTSRIVNVGVEVVLYISKLHLSKNRYFLFSFPQVLSLSNHKVSPSWPYESRGCEKAINIVLPSYHYTVNVYINQHAAFFLQSHP